MTDAPERIWADDAGCWWRLESDENPGALIEYVRADLHDALRARISELEASLATVRNEALEDAAQMLLRKFRSMGLIDDFAAAIRAMKGE